MRCQGQEEPFRFIEDAVKEYLVQRTRKKRELEDLAILNKKADKLNKEAADVLFYQARTKGIGLEM
jgi:hypothetical protein